jgi:threonine/homoserine/homoserine lactone efflux protein
LNVEILPLAITMMAGPQIMSAIIFVTSDRVVPVSLAFVAGVALAVAVGVAAAAGIASLLGDSVSLGDDSETGSAGTIIQIALVALLIAGAIKNYVGRETVEPPKWLGKLQTADLKQAFRTGLLVILIMPSDVIIMLTVGMNLEHSGSSLSDALPFVAATVLIAALPLIGFLIFHRRARRAMPKVRDWMNANSWLVNIIVCCIFVALIL